jgi:hypothetical protein
MQEAELTTFSFFKKQYYAPIKALRECLAVRYIWWAAFLLIQDFGGPSD